MALALAQDLLKGGQRLACAAALLVAHPQQEGHFERRLRSAARLEPALGEAGQARNSFSSEEQPASPPRALHHRAASPPVTPRGTPSASTMVCSASSGLPSRRRVIAKTLARWVRCCAASTEKSLARECSAPSSAATSCSRAASSSLGE